MLEIKIATMDEIVLLFVELRFAARESVLLLFRHQLYSRILGVSSVAQLVEHVAVNHRVAGSSPARGADTSSFRSGSLIFLFLPLV